MDKSKETAAPIKTNAEQQSIAAPASMKPTVLSDPLPLADDLYNVAMNQIGSRPVVRDLCAQMRSDAKQKGAIEFTWHAPDDIHVKELNETVAYFRCVQGLNTERLRFCARCMFLDLGLKQPSADLIAVLSQSVSLYGSDNLDDVFEGFVDDTVRHISTSAMQAAIERDISNRKLMDIGACFVFSWGGITHAMERHQLYNANDNSNPKKKAKKHSRT